MVIPVGSVYDQDLQVGYASRDDALPSNLSNETGQHNVCKQWISERTYLTKFAMTELPKGEPDSSESMSLSISFNVKSCDLPASSYSVFAISTVYSRFDKLRQTLLCRQLFAQASFWLTWFSGARLLFVLSWSLRVTRSKVLSQVGP